MNILPEYYQEGCHSERSEESVLSSPCFGSKSEMAETLRFAQGDKFA